MIKKIGVKNDFKDNKLMWDLLPIKEVEKIVDILTFGAKKYAPNNWQNVEDAENRYYAATMRHLVEYRKGNKSTIISASIPPQKLYLSFRDLHIELLYTV